MTRKHFEALALWLAQEYTNDGRTESDTESAARSMADTLSHFNPVFDPQRFVDAVLKEWKDEVLA